MGCVHYVSSFTRARDARATSRATHDVARAERRGSYRQRNRRQPTAIRAWDEAGAGETPGAGAGGGLTNARARDANRRMNC